MRKAQGIAVSLLAVGALALTACGGGNSGGGSTGSEAKSLRIIYETTDANSSLDALMKKVKSDFEAAHNGVSVNLQPVQGSDTDYATKLALSQRSPDTAPDVFYEDSFNVRADVDAGYLLNLDSRLAKWDDWKNYNEASKAAGKGDDGSIYAVPLGTDTRAIWYNKTVLQKAGVQVPWEPKTWSDILDAARKIKAAEPGVVPFNMYAGKGTGEGTVMQSFYELLYGTGSALYDEQAKKWVTGSQGFKDSLTFLKTLYDEKLAVTPAEALDANIWKKVFGELFPQNKIGGTVEGSYSPSFWQKGGLIDWPAYTTTVGVAPFPTQNGQAPGSVSMSGGWTLAVGANSKAPDLAFEFLTQVVNEQNSLAFTVANSQIAVRTDVAKEAKYLDANPFVKAVSDLVSVTHYRPATADYPKISTAVQEATEVVITGKKTPEQAAADYDKALTDIVGQDKVVRK